MARIICPITDESVKYFNEGSSHHMRGEYKEAIFKFYDSLKSGYNDEYTLCQIIIDTAVEDGLLERKTIDGTAELKKTDGSVEKKYIDILTDVIKRVESYDGKNRSSCALQR